jgi:hypothetical protein
VHWRALLGSEDQGSRHKRPTPVNAAPVQLRFGPEVRDDGDNRWIKTIPQGLVRFTSGPTAPSSALDVLKSGSPGAICPASALIPGHHHLLRRGGLSAVRAALDLQVDQQDDHGTDHRPNPTRRLDEAVTPAKKDPAEEATDNGPCDAEQNRL